MDPLEMTAAELVCLREGMGFTVRAVAAALEVTERTIHRWERKGPGQMRRSQADRLVWLVEYTDRAVEDLVAAHAPGERIVTYATDQAYRGSNPEVVLSAAWHRQVARRAAERCGARIDYEQA